MRGRLFGGRAFGGADALVLKEAFRLIGVDNGVSQKLRYVLEEGVTHEPC